MIGAARAISDDDSASSDPTIEAKTYHQLRQCAKGERSLTSSVPVTLVRDAILLEDTSSKDNTLSLIDLRSAISPKEYLGEELEDDGRSRWMAC